MNKQDLMIGNMMAQGGGSKKEGAVIARLPPHIKSCLMLLAFSNSIFWAAFGFGWLGFEEGTSIPRIILSTIAATWCVAVIPFVMWLITRTDWGQRGS